MVDTVIDILDSATGTLLARTKVKGGLSLSRSGVLYRPRVSDIGVIQVDVFDIVSATSVCRGLMTLRVWPG
jgi:hypothetical protein